jgi:hypothetical protein
MTRHPDWMKRLMAFVTARPQPDFAYGRHDCALFAAGAVLAMTGTDFAAPYRGRYTTLTGGLRVLRRDGFADHVALAAAHLPECHPSQLLPGDLAVLPAPDDQRALGVVQGAAVYLLDPAGRIAMRPLAEAVQGFRV